MKTGRYEEVDGWSALVEYIKPLGDEKHMVRVNAFFDRVLMRHCWSITIYKIGSGDRVTHEGLLADDAALKTQLDGCLRYARDEMLPRAMKEKKG